MKECSGSTGKGRDTYLILCRFYGGYGGEENYVMCMLDALKDCPARVFVTERLLHHGLLPESRSNLIVSLYSPSGFISYLARNHRRIAALIGFSEDRFPRRRHVLRALDLCSFPKLINPAGNSVARIAGHFDHIIWECDNADLFGFKDHSKNAVLPPPALHPGNRPADAPVRIAGKEFYLTVFNDYSVKVKGTEALYETARGSVHPIVWFTSRTRLPEGIPGKLYPMSGSRGVISMFLASCKAYVSFSVSEGFGWSVFEAMTHRRPVVSRPVGVAGDHAEMISTYMDTQDLIRILNDGEFPSEVEYDLGRYSPDSYVRTLKSIIGSRS